MVVLGCKGVVLMVDMCGRGWGRGVTNERHCIARAAWSKTQDTDSWSSGVPLQLGGLAHKHPRPSDFGWTTGPHPEPLTGCISHLTINGEVSAFLFCLYLLLSHFSLICP